MSDVAKIDDNSPSKKHFFQSWNKSINNLSPNFVNDIENGLKKEKNSNPNNNSIFSLHIKAFENSTDLFDETKECSRKNGQENAIDIFADLASVIKNPFEFPRQQETDKGKTPEVAQHRASQRLHQSSGAVRLKKIFSGLVFA
uniref:Uncharacterized protein n=1 Tax=Panagrolaimus davidi TaxID=227884 RepID=A0A914PWB7_9BILA